jgi:hypothetical protein
MSVGIPLKHIIDSYLIEEGRDSKHKYLQYLHLANDGLRELQWDVNGSTQTAKLTPDSNNIIKLPQDFVKEVRIAILASDGTLIPLGRNEDIFKGLDNCGNYTNGRNNDTQGALTVNSMNTSSEHFSKGQYIGRDYGIGGRSTAGEYKINTRTGEIWLSTVTGTSSVILEYIGYMPERVNGQFMVHPFLKEPLLNWIDYASKRRTASPQMVDYLFDRYLSSKQWARQRFWNMDYNEVLEAARKNFTQTPKR